MDNERETFSALADLAKRYGEALPAAPDLTKLNDALSHRNVLIAVVLERSSDPQVLEPIIEAKVLRLKNTEEYYRHFQFYLSGRYETFYLFLLAKKRYRKVSNQLSFTFVEQESPRISVDDFTGGFVRLRGTEITRKVSYLPKFPVNLVKGGQFLVILLHGKNGEKIINGRAHLYDPCYLAWVQGRYQTFELWLLSQKTWEQFQSLYDRRAELEFRPKEIRQNIADRNAEGSGGAAPDAPSDDLACG